MTEGEYCRCELVLIFRSNQFFLSPKASAWFVLKSCNLAPPSCGVRALFKFPPSNQTIPQVRHSYVPITAAEYDAAAQRTPGACLHRACGDLRTGAQLLADAAADARVRLSSLAHSADGCTLVRQLIGILRCHLAAYARAVGSVAPVKTVGELYARHPAAAAAACAAPTTVQPRRAPPHAAALWQPAHDGAAPQPAAAQRATEPLDRQPPPARDSGAGGDAAWGGGEWSGAEPAERLEGPDPFHDDWTFWDPAPPPAQHPA
jgi:hypothetical protein